MAEERLRADWDRTAALLAMLVNVNRDPRKSAPARPGEFNPFRKPARKAKGSIHDLKVLVSGRNKRPT